MPFYMLYLKAQNIQHPTVEDGEWYEVADIVGQPFLTNKIK